MSRLDWIVLAAATLVGAAAPAFGKACPSDLVPPAYKFVDLRDHANNSGLNGNWTKDYSQLGTNELSLVGPEHVPFLIPTAEGSHNRLIMKGRGAKSVIKFDDWAADIFFFGSTHAWLPLAGLQGKYVVHYDDEDELAIEIELVGGDNIGDHCCNYGSEALPNAPVAWRDETQIQSPKPALIRELRWHNPFPDKKITEIHFIDEEQIGDAERWPMLFAITYSPPKLAGVEVLKAGGTSHYGVLGEADDLIFSREASTCVLVTLYDESQQFMAMAHMNQYSLVDEGIDEMLKDYQWGAGTLRAHVAGGNRDGGSVCLRGKVMSALKDLVGRSRITTEKRNPGTAAVWSDGWAGFVDGEFVYCDKEEANSLGLPAKTNSDEAATHLPATPVGCLYRD